MLSLVRSVKNSFAPVNRIPPEILSLIPDYCCEDDVDQSLIALTHVCRGWRDMFISRSSLWAHLDPTSVDKTYTYIQRSKSSPLDIYLKNRGDTYPDGVFLLVTPHIHRLKSLTIRSDVLPNGIRHFSYHAPLLEKLDINLTRPNLPVSLFGRDLSSLRELSLCGVATGLPWNNLANLTTFTLKSCLPKHDFITRLLNFFECAPLLHAVVLEDSIPISSDAPPGRIVSLRHLDTLAITARPAHSILLNHLRIPTGALLVLGASFNNERSLLRDCLLETSTNLKNLSHITTVNLHFDATRKYVRLNGPSGGVYVLGNWEDETVPTWITDRRILRSFSSPIFSTTQRLAVSKYKPPKPVEVEKCPVFQSLSSMNDLRTLVLTKCHNLPFILALNPEKNTSKIVPCPQLEELVLYIKSRDLLHIKPLIGMAKSRALRNAKLSLITIIGPDEPAPAKEELKLREHITDVDCRVDDALPDWDDLPYESGEESE